jgi:hypothetical protein
VTSAERYVRLVLTPTDPAEEPAEQVLELGLLDEENGEINGNGNLFSQRFSQVGCGVAQSQDGQYWIAIEYQ